MTQSELDVLTVVEDDGNQKLRETIDVEIDIEDRPEAAIISIREGAGFFEEIRSRVPADVDLHIFERDHDEPLTSPPHGRKAMRLVAHRARLLTVEVRYDHQTHSKKFAPSKTVFKVLQWAVGKHGFNLDATAAAKANLILPGASDPLPRDEVIGNFVKPHEHVLIVDLTLKDFTNG